MPIAKDIMSGSLLTLDVNTTIGEAIDELVAHSFSAAPVMQDGQMVGIVSELELFDVLFDPKLRHKPLAEVMEAEVIAVDECESLGRVAHLFALHEIRRVPVLRNGKPVGILSRRDLLRYASDCDEPLADPLAELMQYMDDDSTVVEQG